MNIGDKIAIYSKGLADYIVMNFPMPSVVIGFNSKETYDTYAPLSSAVFVANGVKVYEFNKGVITDDVLNQITNKEAPAAVYISVEDNILMFNIYNDKGQVANFNITYPKSIDEVRIGDYKAGIAAGCISLI